MRDPLPTDLVRALAARGLRLTGPVGVGSSGPRWGAVDPDGTRVTVTLVPETPATTRRVAVLGRLRHQGLAGPLGVVPLPEGRAVLGAEVPGADLVTVGAARGPWRPGEVATLVTAVAEALAALHAAGLAHGDVAPANIVLRPDGAPVLVDLLGGHDAGTRGFAAPERATGPSTPAGDVYALAAVGLRLLGAGGPSPVRDLLAEAMAADPERRPPAAAFARRVAAAQPPEPIDVPDPGSLAVAGLRRLAGGHDEPHTERRTQGRTRWWRRWSRSRGRHRRRDRAGALVTAAVGVVVLGATIAVTTGAVPSLRPDQAPSVVAPSVAAPPGAPDVRPQDPRIAAVRLTVVRAEALVTGDRIALAGVTVPGSPAARQDALTAARRGTGGEPADVRVAIGRVDLLAPRGQGAPGCLTRVRIAADVTTGEPADDPGSVTVVLCPGAGGWRVSAVEP